MRDDFLKFDISFSKFLNMLTFTTLYFHIKYLFDFASGLSKGWGGWGERGEHSSSVGRTCDSGSGSLRFDPLSPLSV